VTDKEIRGRLINKAAGLIMAHAEISEKSDEEMGDEIRALYELSNKQIEDRIMLLRGVGNASDEELKELRRLAGLEE